MFFIYCHRIHFSVFVLIIYMLRFSIISNDKLFLCRFFLSCIIFRCIFISKDWCTFIFIYQKIDVPLYLYIKRLMYLYIYISKDWCTFILFIYQKIDVPLYLYIKRLMYLYIIYISKDIRFLSYFLIISCSCSSLASRRFISASQFALASFYQ